MSFRRLFRRISYRVRRKSRRLENISLPTGFEHRVHVILDKKSGKYIGLPPQWVAIMNTKTPQSVRRSNSSPDLRHYTAKTQNGRTYTTIDDMSSILQGKRTRNSLETAQENTIERLKLELRDYRAKYTSEVSENRYSWQDGPSPSPRVNGNVNSIERRNEKLGNVSSPSPVSFTGAFRSESSV